MRNSYAPISKKKRRANKFKPSTSLAEFAETEGLDLTYLTEGVTASTDIKVRYTRGTTPYYHISEVRAWLANSEGLTDATV